MKNEIILKDTIDQMPEAEQVVAVARELYRGAGKLNMTLDPATAQKTLFPIAKELIKDFAGIFELGDITDAFDAAVRHEIPADNHFGKMSFEYAYSVLNSWRSVKWSRAVVSGRKLSRQRDSEDYARWKRNRLLSLVNAYNAVKEGRPLSINPEGALAIQVEGRLEVLGYACDRRERWKLPQLLADAVITRGVSLRQFLGRLLPENQETKN